jgi:hypothetical protein
MNDATTPVKHAILAARRLLSILVSRLRRAFGGLTALVLHDQLGDLSRQTQRLGAASVESVSYLGGELKALDERLSRIEDELAAIHEMLDQGGRAPESPIEAADEITSGPTSG